MEIWGNRLQCVYEGHVAALIWGGVNGCTWGHIYGCNIYGGMSLHVGTFEPVLYMGHFAALGGPMRLHAVWWHIASPDGTCGCTLYGEILLHLGGTCDCMLYQGI